MTEQLVPILTGLTTALVSVAGTLAALLKWYLPQHDKVLHNPSLEELKAIHTCLDSLVEDTRKRHNTLLEILDIINRKVTK